MIMTRDFKFDIKDRVKIIELECSGTVLSIWLDRWGNTYEVRYFHNGKAEKEYFYESELERSA